MTFLGGLPCDLTQVLYTPSVPHHCPQLPSAPTEVGGGLLRPELPLGEGKARGLAPGSNLGGRFGTLPQAS